MQKNENNNLLIFKKLSFYFWFLFGSVSIIFLGFLIFENQSNELTWLNISIGFSVATALCGASYQTFRQKINKYYHGTETKKLLYVIFFISVNKLNELEITRIRKSRYYFSAVSIFYVIVGTIFLILTFIGIIPEIFHSISIYALVCFSVILFVNIRTHYRWEEIEEHFRTLDTASTV